jgi:hypothetical protein
MTDLKAWAHNRGLSQAEFSDVLGIYAAREARQAAVFQAAAAKQVELLGSTATMRVTAVETFLRGQLGDQLAGKMRPMIVTAAIVEGFEALARKFASQGSASFTQSHRVPQDASGRVSDEAYAAMSHSERQQYARGFDQSQFKTSSRDSAA